jgi:hypothetical protein
MEEIDSVNYLHYLIEWMGNRGNPHDFASYYSPFWEISFLPVWLVTRVDLFFPLLALKGVALVGIAAWLLGRELDMPPLALGCVVFSVLLMRHYWLEYSGVATIKNDAPQAAGFLLLALVVMRAARGSLARADWILLALGIVFGTVKFLGLVISPLAVLLVVWLIRRTRGLVLRLAALAAVFVLTTGHTYWSNWRTFGNPVYPMPLHLGPFQLPGAGADISNTSILYNLHDPRLWRAFFLPADALSPLGILFPEILAAALLICAWLSLRWLLRRRKPAPREWLALLILGAWLLYFRAPWSASAGGGDLAYVLNSLDSMRLVEGVLAASEILLASMLGRYAIPLAALQAVSRLWWIDRRLPLDLFPLPAVCVAAVIAATLVLTARRYAVVAAAAALILACPAIVERNRVHWTVYWNDLKPALAAVRGPDLAYFGMNEASYWAGHVVAAGNPVHPEVRALLPEDLAALAPAARPRYLAVLVTPGFDWRAHYGPQLAAWGYRAQKETATGALLQKVDLPR